MRLSEHIKNKKWQSPVSPGAAPRGEPPVQRVEKETAPTEAPPQGRKVAPSEGTAAAPVSAGKGDSFRLTELIKRKQGLPASVPPPPQPAEKESAAAEVAPKGTAAAPVSAGKGDSFRLTELIKRKQGLPASVPPPPQPAEKESAAEEAPPKGTAAAPLSAGKDDSLRPPLKLAALPETESFEGLIKPKPIRQFEAHPARMYAAAQQAGIALPPNRHATIKNAKACLALIFEEVLQCVGRETIIWHMIKSVTADLEGLLAADSTLLSLIYRHRVEEENLLWHSLYTAILAMDMAQHVDNLDCSAHDMGGAALIHDVGLLVKTHSHNFTDHKANGADYYDHVARGVELAQNLGVPDVVLTMISQHHGRLDGKGFPPQLDPSTFPCSSQILAISNTFEHAVIQLSTEKKEVESAASEENEIPQIFNMYRHAFNYDLLKKMIALIGFYPTGSIVELNNRAICEIVRQNPDFPIRPVVKVIVDSGGNHPEREKCIDLKEEKVLSIIGNIARPKTT